MYSAISYLGRDGHGVHRTVLGAVSAHGAPAHVDLGPLDGLSLVVDGVHDLDARGGAHACAHAASDAFVVSESRASAVVLGDPLLLVGVENGHGPVDDVLAEQLEHRPLGLEYPQALGQVLRVLVKVFHCHQNTPPTLSSRTTARLITDRGMKTFHPMLRI